MTNSVREIANQLEPGLRDEFLAAVEQTRQEADFVSVVSALKAGDIDEALRLLGLTEGSFKPLLARLDGDGDSLAALLREGYQEAGERAKDDLGVGPIALGVAAVFVATIVAAITSKSAAGLEAAVRDASTKTLTLKPERLAARLRDAVGLTARQTKSLNAYRDAFARIIENPSPTLTQRLKIGGRTVIDRTRPLARLRDYLSAEEMARLSASQRGALRRAISKGNLTPEQADRMVEQHRRHLVRLRAKAIARTEATKVTSAGQQEALENAVRSGLIDASTTMRVWVTAGDERVRTSHAAVPAMNSGGVAIGEAFRTPLGPSMYPPLEINCRCRIALRRVTSGNQPAAQSSAK